MNELEHFPNDYKNLFIGGIEVYDFLGLHLFANKENYLGRYLKLTILMSIFVLSFIGQAVHVIFELKSGDGFLHFIYAAVLILPAVQEMVKTVTMIIQIRKMEALILGIGELWPDKEMLSSEKYDVYLMWISRGKMFNIVFYFYSRLGGAVFAGYPILVSIYNIVTNKPDPYTYSMSVYIPWNTDSMIWFIILTAYYGLVAVLLMAMYVASNILLAILTGCLSLLLNLLQIDIRNCVTKTTREDGVLSLEEKDCEELDRIIVEHQKVLKLAEEIQLIFGPIAFSEILFSGIIICFNSFISMVAQGSQRFIGIAGLFGNMGAILNYAWPGQYLYEMSSGIADAAYNCYWYKRGPKFKKNILMIIRRAQRPCYVSALGFSYMLLLTFSRILGTAWSYFTLLNQIYEG